MRRSWLPLLCLACSAQQPAPPPVQRAEPRSEPPPAPSSSVSLAAPAKAARGCDITSCDYASEACCEADAGRAMTGCVKRSLAPPDKGHRCYGPRAADWMGMECRTSADCPSPKRCCATSIEGDSFNHCAERCEESVACVPGAAHGCSAGFRCEPAAESRSGGVCLVEQAKTSCAAQICSGPTPACCYDAKSKKARCVAVLPESHTVDDAACPLNEHTAFLQCTSPADCGGEHCCTAGPVDRTTCSGMCTTGTWTCRTVEDCPPFIGPATGCARDPKIPFLKTCQYAQSANGH